MLCFCGAVMAAPVTSVPAADNRRSPPPVCTRRAVVVALLSTAAASLAASPAAVLASERVADPGGAANVVTSPSGLRWYDFSTGSGDPVLAGDVVRFHLVTGTTGARNGWKIASTYASDALVVRVGTGEVVPGLDEALRGMRVGGRRRALVPPTLGYSGKVGKGQAPVPTEFAAYQRFKNIYLNSARPFIPDVVFDIEVLKITHR